MGKDEYSFEFSDLTIIEGHGRYDEVKAIMDSEVVPVPNWMLESDLYMCGDLGEANIVLHFYANKDVYIVSFKSDVMGNDNSMYNPFVTTLSVWCQDNGWNMPEVYFLLAKDNVDFWKYFWDTGIVKS
jgi:hypothetical protein